MRRGLWLCRGCRRQVSVTVGTMLQDSRVPLRKWFRAIWHVTSQPHGPSAVALKRELRLGSYRTAWALLLKLRRAMRQSGRDRLSGVVEVMADWTLAMIAVEVKGEGIGRIRVRDPGALARGRVEAFIRDMIKPGSTIRTGGPIVRKNIPGYRFARSSRGASLNTDALLLPRAHRVASRLRRWLREAHQGASGLRQPPPDLDEFAFRLNCGTSVSPGKLFHSLVQQALVMPPIPFDAIRGHQPE